MRVRRRVRLRLRLRLRLRVGVDGRVRRDDDAEREGLRQHVDAIRAPDDDCRHLVRVRIRVRVRVS